MWSRRRAATQQKTSAPSGDGAVIIHVQFMRAGQLFTSCRHPRRLSHEVLPMPFALRTITSRAAAVTFAALLLTGTAFAQTTTPAPAPASPPSAAKTAPAPKMAKAKPEMSAESKECSAEADAKGLHGKERQKFRAKCKREARKGDATKSDATKK
jgi:hypothetical protein